MRWTHWLYEDGTLWRRYSPHRLSRQNSHTVSPGHHHRRGTARHTDRPYRAGGQQLRAQARGHGPVLRGGGGTGDVLDGPERDPQQRGGEAARSSRQALRARADGPRAIPVEIGAYPSKPGFRSGTATSRFTSPTRFASVSFCPQPHPNSMRSSSRYQSPTSPSRITRSPSSGHDVHKMPRRPAVAHREPQRG